MSSLWRHTNVQQWVERSQGRQIKPHLSTFAQNGVKSISYYTILSCKTVKTSLLFSCSSGPCAKEVWTSLP